jgi:ADP-ribose pyrophosphatase YjhB (NUDIX family)
MNYCSNCASKLDFRLIEDDHLPRFVCDDCETIHYQNPRVIVGCLPIFEGKILLCKRGIEPRKGFWNIPGGFMENGEHIEEGALREANEEANLTLRSKGLLSVFTVPKINQVHMHFLTEVLDNNWNLTTETTDIQLFSEDEIPWDDIAFPSNLFTLNTYLENKKTNDWQVKVSYYEIP